MRNPSKKKDFFHTYLYGLSACLVAVACAHHCRLRVWRHHVVRLTTPRRWTLSRNTPHVPAHPGATSSTSLLPLPAHPLTPVCRKRHLNLGRHVRQHAPESVPVLWLLRGAAVGDKQAWGNVGVGGGTGVGGGVGRDGEQVGGGRSPGEVRSDGRPTTRSGTVNRWWRRYDHGWGTREKNETFFL
jgi:hypothetical protein